MTYDFIFNTHGCSILSWRFMDWENYYTYMLVSSLWLCVAALQHKPSKEKGEKKKKNFPSVLFFLINITFPQVRIKKKVFVIVVQIQFQIELFFWRAGAFCHMLTFYHWCHLDSFPWQCSDGGLLTHAERGENPYSTTCCLSVWQSSALTT